MKVFESLPDLSARIGFLKTVANWKDAVSIEFGPEGTMHYIQSDIAGYTENLFTTGIRESEIIFGDTRRLEQAILDLDRDLKPRIIFILSSPVSQIIGADLRGLIEKINRQVEAKLLVWENIATESIEEEGRVKAYKEVASLIKDIDKNQKLIQKLKDRMI